MPSFTSRLGLTKPAGGEDVDIDLLNTNFDTLDKNAGVEQVTSTTRPTGTNRYPGKVIYETDTRRTFMFSGTEWVCVQGGWYLDRYRTGANQVLTAASFTEVVWTDTRDNPAINGRKGNPTDWGLTDFGEDKSRLVCPETGLYMMTVQLRLAVANTARSTQILTTGGEQFSVEAANNAENFFTVMVPMSKGDVFYVRVYVNTAVGLTSDTPTSAAERTYFKVAQVL